MLGVVLAGVLAPLLRAPTFYYWDDTAGAAVGAWRHIGDSLLDGRLPLLSLELWRGGNYAAEASFGLYNPPMLALHLLTRPIDDLAIVTVVIKAFFFLTLALGAYLLCRAYGARPWPSALAGTILPLSGFTLWMEGAAWVTGLVVTATLPWVWFTAKRALDGNGSLVWAVIAGYVCASVSNPYGLLVCGIVFAGLMAEGLLRRLGRRVVELAVAGVCVALLAVPSFLPFILSSSVSYRANSGIHNDEFLSPSLSDLVGLSSPSFQPYITAFGEGSFSFPALYLSFLFLPLLPWLHWSRLRGLGRQLAAIYVVGAVALLFLLGPSQVGFFRWPVRLVPYVWLPLVVLFAVLLSAGIRRSRPRVRLGLTAGTVFAGFWLAVSDIPSEWDRHAFSLVMVSALVVAVLWAARRSERLMAVAAMIATLVVLLVQLSWMPVNGNVLDYRFPRSQAAMERSFADYKPGLTVQVADLGKAPDRSPEGLYQDLLFGSMYAVVGVESLTAYSGVGFNDLDAAQCIAYQGSTCAAAWEILWEEPQGSDAALADLLRAQRVVVQRELIDTRDEPAPDGWRLDRSTSNVDVWERAEALPWPEGRLSEISGPVAVSADRRVGAVGERVSFQREGTGPASLTFARLAWPGYSAEIDGRSVPVRQGPAGLLQIEVPDDIEAGELVLDWAPPGMPVALAAAGLGLAAMAALAGAEFRRRRTSPATGPQHGPGIPDVPAAVEHARTATQR
jgi:hypothetical protein